MNAPGRSRSADPRLRGALLMPLCVLAVHQLRFYLVFGGHTGTRLAREGHAYVSAAEPLALLAAAIAAGGLIGRAAQAWQRTNRDGSARDLDHQRTRGALWRTWVLCALALLGIYAAQELIEGAFASGHPAGLAGVVGSGGWIAVPVSLLIAGALTCTLRLADALLRLVSQRRTGGRHAACTLQPHRVARATDWRLDPASGVAAGRAPPPSFSFSRP